MADVSVTINPPNSTSVTIGNAVSAHGATHAPGSSDSLENYYYPRTNPSGYATSGDFATTGYVGEVSGYLNSQISFPSNVVFTTGGQTIDGLKNFSIRPTINGTGVLLSGEASIGNTGYLTGYVQKTETGEFYPRSNPSGYITGVNLSAYQTITASTGISGYLQNQISAINFSSGQFLTTGAGDSRYLTEENDPVFSSSAAYLINSTLTGQWGASYSGSITGISVNGTSSKTITLYQRDGSTLTASFSDIEGTGGSGTDYFLTGASFNSGNGNLNLYVNNGSTVIVSIEGRYITGNVVRPNETGSFITSGDLGNYQTISGSTGISGYLQSQISNIDLTPTGAFLTTGAADLRYYSQSNPSGYLTSANILNLATTGYVTGVSGYLQTQISAISNGTGNFITGVNLDSYQTITGSTGISGYLQGQISSINSSTGSFLTGVDLSTYATIALTTGISGYQSGLISSLYDATGLYALKSNTGSFLTTGEADSSYYNLANGQSISGFAITGFNNAITGISITGDTLKFITLFQRGGSTVTGSFSDNAGTGGSSPASLSGNNYNVYVTGSYTASFGEKILADTSSTGFIVTMPSSPVTGGTVYFADFAGTWATNNLIISGNGSRIFSDAENLICNSSGASFFLVYINTGIGYNLYYG